MKHAPLLPVRPKTTRSMQTRDGVRLDADVYYPDIEGEFPVLLMRQPYGRAIASTVVYAHPAWYAAHGYIVVIQDVRGRGTSEGDFRLFAHEREDGFDTVSWVAQLPGSTGQVGMYGFSYQGMTQLYAATQHPPALKTICPSMVGYDLYHDWAYEGGAFRYQLNLGWAIQLAAETARRQGDADAYQTLYTASRQLPLSDPVNAHSALLQHLAPDSFYHDWLKHPQPDAYWETLSPHQDMAQVDLPMLHIGGWFDPYMTGTLRLYREMVGRSQYPQHLVVGPWAHLPWGRKVGTVDYGPAANTPIDRLQIRWFDQMLKGPEPGLLDEPSVLLFELGHDEWQAFHHWPRPTPKRYALTSTGLASLGDEEGVLMAIDDAFTTAELPMTIDYLVHDPWRPVPASGGHAVVPAGPCDRQSLDCRTDVLTYTSNPLSSVLTLVGEVVVELYLSADQPSFDVSVVVSDVSPQGTVVPFAQGYCRCHHTWLKKPLQLVLQPCSIRLTPGHSLRLSISAACFPAFPVNPGTGATPALAQAIEAQVTTLQLHSGKTYPSQMVLPVVEA